MLLDDFYGEGRLPLIKKQVPFYANLPNHLAAEELKHRFRNRDKVLISLFIFYAKVIIFCEAKKGNPHLRYLMILVGLKHVSSMSKLQV